MYIVEVTPFSKSMRTDSLSYFSKTKVLPGCVVTVPLRSKSTKGLVTAVKNVKDLKTELRQSQYTLKKVTGVSKNILFSEEFLTAAAKSAEYFATSSGSIIQGLIPKNLLNDIEKLKKAPAPKNKKILNGSSGANTPANSKSESSNSKENVPVAETTDEETEHPKYIIQTEDKDRYSEYKSIIRGQFAKGKSVLFCVPTMEDGMYAKDSLSRGIESHTFVLNSKMTKTQLVKSWNEVVDRDKPSLIIVTGGMTGIPIANLGTIILERESSNAYKTRQRPHFDMRYFIEEYASALNADFIVGDLMLRAETLWRYDQHEFTEFTPIKFRSITDATQKIVDMKKDEEVSKKDQFISRSLDYMLEEAIENSEKVFLLTSSKGLAPLVACSDCGEVVRCEHCSSPVKLHGRNSGPLSNINVTTKTAREKENYFRCHTCGHERSAGETCINCNSWRLMTVGAGTEKVETELKKKFLKTKILILDKDHASTPKKAQKIIQDFNESASAILIGTEMALLYLRDQVENVGIISVDSLFGLPDFRIRERILNVLLKARALASQDFIIQTRNTEEGLFQNIVDGNLTDFYRKEFIDRKKFNYPPFSLIIKISLAAKTNAQIEKQFDDVKDVLAPQELVTYPAFVETVRGKKVVHGMIKINREDWPDKYLVERLKNLPPQFQIQIDADSIL
jgi:primosomal protein N'